MSRLEEKCKGCYANYGISKNGVVDCAAPVCIKEYDYDPETRIYTPKILKELEKCIYCGTPMTVVWATNPPMEGEFHCFKCNLHFYIKSMECKKCIQKF